MTGVGHAYSVSGLVEFSYRDYETKIGSQKTSWSEFVQNYRINADTFIFDPRFLIVKGGVGYSHAKASYGDKSDILSYDITTSFFQGMRYSAELNASKFTATISPVGMKEYDSTTTSYGGKASLNFSQAGRNGNNNNNSNNNNGNNFRNRSSFRLPLPDITLEQTHTESESENSINPQHESRDNSRAFINYRIAQTLSFMLDGGIEKYRNFVYNQDYDTKSANLQGLWQVSPNSDLNITGRVYDRTVNNIVGFNPEEKSNGFGFIYDVRETNRLSQNYSFNYVSLANPTARSESENGGGKIMYRLNPLLRLFAGLNYSQVDYIQYATLLNPRQSYRLQTGTFDVGMAYSQVFTPDFMRAFLIHTDYDFSTGFTNVSQTSQGSPGNGLVYGNNLGVGIASNGWQNETVAADYRFSNRRDDSPAGNDMRQQTVSATLATRRIPKTNIAVNGSYTSSEASSNLQNNFAALTGDTRQTQHQAQYNASANYTPTDYLSFSTGAVRSKSQSQTQTLSTLGIPQQFASDEFDLYAMGVLNYNFTRQVDYHLQLRYDHRTTQFVYNLRSDSEEFKTWINYRIRMVYLSLEYRIRESKTGNGPDVTEQYIYTKLSRPF